MRDRTHLPGSRPLILMSLVGIALIVGCKASPAGSPSPTAPKQAAVQAPSSSPAPAKVAGMPTAAKAPGARVSKVKSAAKGLDPQGQMQFSASDRCPVCGMDVGPHRKLASAIALDDGVTYHFCGTGCMIKTWLHPEVFIDTDKARVKRAVTREYFAGEHVDALTAHWVAGSDVVGPMGPALVALKDAPDLKTFKERHGGKTTFSLATLDDAAWEAIRGKKPPMRPSKTK
jgi:copper chaperone NosL